MTISFKTHLFHFTILKRKGGTSVSEKKCNISLNVRWTKDGCYSWHVSPKRRWKWEKTNVLEHKDKDKRGKKRENHGCLSWKGHNSSESFYYFFLPDTVAKETRKTTERPNKWKWKKKDKIFINNWTAKSLEFCAVICRHVNSDRLNPGETARERHAQAHMPARTSFRYC